MPLYICFEARSGELLWYGEGAPKFYSKYWEQLMDRKGLLILTTPGLVQGLGFDPQLIVDADHKDARKRLSRHLGFPVDEERQPPTPIFSTNETCPRCDGNMSFRAPVCDCNKEPTLKKLPTSKTNKPDTFQQRALKTWNQAPDDSEQLMHAVMGLAGEAGELLDYVKKGLFKPNFDASRDNLIEELGDCLYYVAVVSSLLGISVEELSVKNREKLSKGKHGWKDNSSEYLTPEQAHEEIRKVLSSDLDDQQTVSKIYGVLSSLGERYADPLIISLLPITSVDNRSWAVVVDYGKETLFSFTLTPDQAEIWNGFTEARG